MVPFPLKPASPVIWGISFSPWIWDTSGRWTCPVITAATGLSFAVVKPINSAETSFGYIPQCTPPPNTTPLDQTEEVFERRDSV